MATFTVKRIVESFVYYEAQIDANTATEAVKLAREDEYNYEWTETNTTTFDARDFVALDKNGEEIEETREGNL